LSVCEYMFRLVKIYFRNIWPCDLLMVIAKASLTGHCRRCNVNDMVSSDGVRLNLGMSTFFQCVPCSESWRRLTRRWIIHVESCSTAGSDSGIEISEKDCCCVFLEGQFMRRKSRKI
jgi:hypothetical protein